MPVDIFLKLDGSKGTTKTASRDIAATLRRSKYKFLRHSGYFKRVHAQSH
jgi:hypothetical protein